MNHMITSALLAIIASDSEVKAAFEAWETVEFVRSHPMAKAASPVVDCLPMIDVFSPEWEIVDAAPVTQRSVESDDVILIKHPIQVIVDLAA